MSALLQFDRSAMRRIRLERGLTPTKLAQRVSKATNTIWAWESGDKAPRLDGIGRLADARRP